MYQHHLLHDGQTYRCEASEEAEFLLGNTLLRIVQVTGGHPHRKLIIRFTEGAGWRIGHEIDVHTRAEAIVAAGAFDRFALPIDAGAGIPIVDWDVISTQVQAVRPGAGD
jgi:hypothetical protein